MQPFDSIDRLERAKALDPAVKVVSSLVHKVIQPQGLRDLLHGVWLGHPLHPVLVQVPVGAFVSASMLDLVPFTGPATTLLITTGLVSSVPAAAAGLTDWSELNPAEKRTGLVHSGANTVGLLLYGASLLARARRRKARGKALALAGLGAVAAGGVLGGHLSYRRAAGANHTADIPDVGPTDWTAVGALDELPDGALAGRQLGQVPVVLLRRGSLVQALVARCSHLSGPLEEGELTGGTDPCVVCPWHGSEFRFADGSVVHGPAVAPQPVLQTRVTNGQVEVRLPG
ncbi:MAG: Rieske 2Fe-2S domain-containing protein [Actinomycetota bacterium]|nr:Rieske 2Fe-2S domain-containing protein [Actinomycetota bacterium]